MENGIRRIYLGLAYLIIVFAVIPIVRFEFYKRTPEYENENEFFVWLRILFCAPLLLSVGLALVLLSKQKIHRIFGYVSTLLGLYWLVMLIEAIVSEAGG